MLDKPIGILGGTFDPIHMGHLRMAIELQDTMGLECVHVIPCFDPVHRKRPVASPEDRLKMVQLAVSPEPKLIADDREIRRAIPSYTIDTLIEMREEIKNAPFCLFLGIDAFLGFSGWHRFSEILERAHLIVAYRPLYQFPSTGLVADLIKTHIKQDISYIHEHQAGGILFRPITALEISATDIRKQISQGKNPRYLLPDNVYEYIKQRHIYSVPL